MDDPNTYLFPGLKTGGAQPRRVWSKPVTIRGYRKRLREAAEVLQRERSRKPRILCKSSEHPFKDFPLNR